MSGPLDAGERPGDAAEDLGGDAGHAFDADLGLLATAGKLKAGLTIRNALSPDFETAQGAPLELPWRARAGVSYRLLPALLLVVLLYQGYLLVAGAL